LMNILVVDVIPSVKKLSETAITHTPSLATSRK
jgi:hypothetical protein